MEENRMTKTKTEKNKTEESKMEETVTEEATAGEAIAEEATAGEAIAEAEAEETMPGEAIAEANKVEETKTERPTKPEEPTETMDDYKDELEASFRKISEGDIITATVIAVSEEEATLDLKYFAPGIIKAEELSDDPDYAIMEELHPGDEIQATVIRFDDGNGNILLSKKEANQTLAWDKLAQAMEDKTVLKVRVKEAVKAGVIAYAEGLRGFIPASHLSLSYVEDLAEWIGKELEVHVITVDPAKEKLVLSAKTVLKERSEEERSHRISMLAPGTIVEGTVESLTNYGAFVNIGNGLTGMVHVSQVCERRIRKPGEVLKIGQNVKAKILNTNNNRIALSIRAYEAEAGTSGASDSDGEAQSIEKYRSKESATTSLGDILAKLNIH